MAATHPSSFARLAKFIVLLSSGKDTDALQTSPQGLMLGLVEKYSNFTHPLKLHTNETDDHATRNYGKVVHTTNPLDVDAWRVHCFFCFVRSF